jgi:hypothetical protein
MPGFASLTAAADAYRGRLKTRFFNEIDVNRTFGSQRLKSLLAGKPSFGAVATAPQSQ